VGRAAGAQLRRSAAVLGFAGASQNLLRCAPFKQLR
jgi:hypothetical protein